MKHIAQNAMVEAAAVPDSHCAVFAKALCIVWKAILKSHVYRASSHSGHMVQWSEDDIKADPFFGRSWGRFRVPPWVSNTIARDHLA